jgi:hypothetical protein
MPTEIAIRPVRDDELAAVLRLWLAAGVLCVLKTPSTSTGTGFSRPLCLPDEFSLLRPKNSLLPRKKSLLLQNNFPVRLGRVFDQNPREDKANLVSNRPLGGRNREVGDGPVKTLALRGVKDNPPYLHDERLLTLEDTVEFFNLVLGDKLTSQEKAGFGGVHARPLAADPASRT